MFLNEHEERRAVVAEMHLRRWPAIAAPCTVIQIVKLLDREEREQEASALRQILGNAIDADSNPRHVSGRLPGEIAFSCELHSEATTTTLFVTGLVDEWASANATVSQAIRWAIDLPGRVVRATKMLVVSDEATAENLAPDQQFAAMELVSCRVALDDGGPMLRMWSDFRLRDNGFGFVLIAANALQGTALAHVLQRLQELGNYRNLALIGLPVARAGWRELDRIEQALAAMTGKLAREDVTDDALLDEVTRLSIELAAAATESDYRMSATEAYAKIVDERLGDLVIRPVSGYLSLVDFTRRRLLPAVRTCAAHRRRSELLAQRTAQFVSLFRTRIETRIENQNSRLLTSMNASAARQLRLQQLVEGFSVVALTYYLTSLIHHLLEGLAELGRHFHVAVVTAALVPFIACAMWFGIHHAKSKVLR
ncbi:MAG: DUF3422 domain-containing protein [Pseudomonadota bacterium]